MSGYRNTLMSLWHHRAFEILGFENDVIGLKHYNGDQKIKSALLMLKSVSDYPPWLKNSQNVVFKYRAWF